jgi:hypothetical protein
MSTLHWVDGGYVLVKGEDYGPPYSVCGMCVLGRFHLGPNAMTNYDWARIDDELKKHGVRRGVGALSAHFTGDSTVESFSAALRLGRALGYTEVKTFHCPDQGTDVWFSNVRGFTRDNRPPW